MTPLIDGDILLHEMGWSGEFKDKETGDPILLDFDYVADLVEKKLQIICIETGATQPPIIFLSNNEWLNEQQNKRRKWLGEPTVECTPCFRYEKAKTKVYKGTRKNKKPFHFFNIASWLLHNYRCIISSGGLEADDEMCIYQRNHEDTIICSRDKDLRICPGWHYSWECGTQPSHGPVETDAFGWLETRKNGETMGYGLSFFYYQMLIGDSADNIPGLPGCGPVRAKKILDGAKTEMDLFNKVKDAYKEKFGSKSKEYFLEQASLLWMIQERGKGYEFPI